MFLLHKLSNSSKDKHREVLGLAKRMIDKELIEVVQMFLTESRGMLALDRHPVNGLNDILGNDLLLRTTLSDSSVNIIHYDN